MATAGTSLPPAPPVDTDGEGGGGAYERITVNLTRKASVALVNASRLNDANRTDIVNKALVVYDLLLQHQALPGGAIYLRGGDGGDLERLRLL